MGGGRISAACIVKTDSCQVKCNQVLPMAIELKAKIITAKKLCKKVTHVTTH